MFDALSLPENITVFAAAAALVWIAGWHVARSADALESRTGLGEAFLGMLLLGCISALPELAVALTASFEGHPVLAVNNLVGSAAMNLAILAAADAALKREALTSAIATPTPLLQASLIVVMFAVIGGATLAAGDAAFLGIGAWSWGILALYLLCLVLIRNTKAADAWKPRGGRRRGRKREAVWPYQGPLGPIFAKMAAGAAVILAAGYALAQSGEALAQQTGLGQSFFGAVFLACATSLSEISIVVSAVRLGRYEMAIGDLFGSALFTLALVFAVDAAYPGGPVLAELAAPTAFMALLGCAVSALFIAGAVERRNIRIWRMGVDSIALLAAYLGGLYVLYRLR